MSEWDIVLKIIMIRLSIMVDGMVIQY